MYQVLIVDDDKAVRYELKKSKIWANYDFQITAEATNGQEALDKIAQTCFDLIVVDIKMPKIDGLSFLKELRKNALDLCVVIASGYSTFEYARQGIVLGAFDYLLKPVENDKLAEVLMRVKQHLRAKQENLKIVKHLEDNIHTPISKQDEHQLFQMLTEKPEEAPEYARKLAQKISVFYDKDLFKTAILLDCLQDNIRQRLKEDKPWIANFQAVKNENRLQHIKEHSLLLESFLSGIQELASFIQSLHLNHPDSVIKRLCEYVIENIDGKITIETAASQFGFSGSYLGKLFKQKTGEGFVDFITAVKIEKAKQLIRSGKYKIYEISDLLGYKSSDYFCALFKARTHMTPADYRKNSTE